MSAIAVGVIVLSLALFYGIREGAPGPLPLKEVLYGMVDLAAERGSLDEDDIEGYLESVGWTSERLEATMDNITREDPELFWELIGGLESYAQENYGVSLWELGIG
ncbi:MAG: hypothetical protein A2Y64_03805 [Candidatus Coatesbacteria bacterium RBG_13_66_14]|uniref:Uncharacterized protein n=1 Tax=Candidatus Coatesbacteria bacterium RBG_13_66_14 TaxID=1817816 RepID=A0A1F5F738_9BACT|nr:MAG: hypothetical protein A2Y64_03805 [Candidatus Coatesbacteria bacterium RBG_13_66_14]